MTYFEHLPYLENIPAYALGALDAKEFCCLRSSSANLRILPGGAHGVSAHERSPVDERSAAGAFRRAS